jgi:hypothetical protein
MNFDKTNTVFTQILLTKLTKMFGEEQGNKLATELTQKMEKGQVQTPDQLKEVAEALVARGGLSKMIGHSIMVEALLRGAKQ